MPPIDWPALPDPAGQVSSNGETVSMPLPYWLALTGYIIDMETAREIYEAARNDAGPEE